MSKLAIFLGFQPGVKLTNEGIGRLLAFILKEKVNESDSVVLVSPAWLNDSIESLLDDNKISKDKFEILSTRKVPLGVKFKSWMENRKKQSRKKSWIMLRLEKMRSKVYKIIEERTSDYFSTPFGIWLFLKSFLYLISGLILAPFIIFCTVLYLLIKTLKIIKRVSNQTFIKLLVKSSILKRVKFISKNGQHKIYQIVIDNELNRLVDIINNRQDIKATFIPSMIWPQIKRLKCKKILAAPDIVFYDFPTQFSGVSEIHSRIRQSVDSADHLISYSEFVKKQHLIEKCGVDEHKITVIKHANVDMSEHLKLKKSLEKYYSGSQNARQIVEKYIHSNYQPNHVLYNCNIENMDFIIFSSQCRPHKNIFNLIKAVNIINRKLYGNVKLIVTGDISGVNQIQSYIDENHMRNDVFMMYGLSSEVLSAFNKLAKCAVNPTLFEGGFPFTFSEAYSVGTPSIMSNIPVVNTEIDSLELKDLMLFDPYNPYSIAQKIVWAIENHQLLYEKQEKLFGNFGIRDWKVVVDEYNQVFRKFMV
ncbi:glycosyltransferase [Paenibacillus radicis (ex Gao et al. 2016)]|uniref:Glycoside hydrolase n=1 Tax=Paenibacillus radicis (ex Gao et al. 2016) TaxID=1737354 RepID=A0A917H0Z5_9BACL|nr:glycosyltransferase [Paenibacillus radicis (ex Gao et al. 2016)]GGG63337.1 glycoside hydrolase [Paenibacillus radicis (ex Gao et al. 2016)]